MREWTPEILHLLRCQFTSILMKTQLYSCVCHFFTLTTSEPLSPPAGTKEVPRWLTFSPCFIFTSLFDPFLLSNLNLIPADVTS